MRLQQIRSLNAGWSDWDILLTHLTTGCIWLVASTLTKVWSKEKVERCNPVRI